MARAEFRMEEDGTDEVFGRISQAGKKAEVIVNAVLHDYAGIRIEEKIQPLLPVSGREWEGKKAAAKSAQPFRQTDENLAVIVSTKTNYHYLYFPDDGTSTRRHAGQQDFMERGKDSAVPDVLERVNAKVAEEIGG